MQQLRRFAQQRHGVRFGEDWMRKAVIGSNDRKLRDIDMNQQFDSPAADAICRMQTSVGRLI